jgi:hypothetical protein
VVEAKQSYFVTKGDHNEAPIADPRQGLNELRVEHERYVGRAVFRIPLLGYVKIIATDALRGVLSLF